MSMISILLLGIQKSGVVIPEWIQYGESSMYRFLVSVLPVLIMIGAMQFLMYELTSEFVSGVLLQFVVGIALAYLSGCLYPISFFPDSIQLLADILPTGMALRYMNQIMLAETAVMQGIGVILYSIAFLVLAIFVRRKRMVKEA